MAPSPLALWVIPVADLGGVARHVLDVARAGGLPGWRWVVLCPEGPLAGELRGLGAAVQAGDLGPDAGTARSVRTVRTVIRRLRPAVVHSHLAHADIVCALALRGLRGERPRLISTEHGIAPDDAVYHGAAWKSRLMAAVHHARTHAFDHLIAVCDSTRDVMLAKWRPAAPITVVRNGVGRQERQPAGGSARVASLARLAREKNLPALLDAFALVHAERPDATLTLAGTGPLLDELASRAQALGLADAVSFPGYVDAGELMARSDVVAQLSVWENCSYTLLDAAARGLGVVATPVGGNPEILPPRCLVDASDARAIASRILAQAGDTAERPTLDPSWPTVVEMTRRIVAVYAGAAR